MVKTLFTSFTPKLAQKYTKKDDRNGQKKLELQNGNIPLEM